MLPKVPAYGNSLDRMKQMLIGWFKKKMFLDLQVTVGDAAVFFFTLRIWFSHTQKRQNGWIKVFNIFSSCLDDFLLQSKYVLL